MKLCGLDLSISSSGVIVEEVDDKFDVIDVKYYGFTQVRKNEQENIKFYSNKDFINDYDKYYWMYENIIEWIKDCKYVAVEDYGYGATGMVFNLAEFEGFIKINKYMQGATMKFYAPTQVKKFFAGKGNKVYKIDMYNAFMNYNEKKPDISTLPELRNPKTGTPPTSDIIDAYAICELLRKEIRVKLGIETIDNMPKNVKEVFVGTKKKVIEGLMAENFVRRGGCLDLLAD